MLGEPLPRNFKKTFESCDKVLKDLLASIELDPASPVFKALIWIKESYSNINIYVKNALGSFQHYAKFYQELKTKMSRGQILYPLCADISR